MDNFTKWRRQSQTAVLQMESHLSETSEALIQIQGRRVGFDYVLSWPLAGPADAGARVRIPRTTNCLINCRASWRISVKDTRRTACQPGERPVHRTRKTPWLEEEKSRQSCFSFSFLFFLGEGRFRACSGVFGVLGRVSFDVVQEGGKGCCDD